MATAASRSPRRRELTPGNARRMERRAGKGAPVKLVIYPGAYHSFDLPNVGNGRQFFGHWLKYDADAAQRSVLEMREFLAAQLAK